MEHFRVQLQRSGCIRGSYLGRIDSSPMGLERPSDLDQKAPVDHPHNLDEGDLAKLIRIINALGRRLRVWAEGAVGLHSCLSRGLGQLHKELSSRGGPSELSQSGLKG